MKQKAALSQPVDRYVGKNEFILYLLAIFFYSSMTGMVGSYRQNFLVDILGLESNTVSFINAFCSIANFLLGFFYAMVIDNHKTGKNGKFKPIAAIVAIPFAVITVLMFITPPGLSGTLLVIYLISIALMQSAGNTFSNVLNLVSFVMTPNSKERDKVISFRGISSAVGNSAPLVIVLVLDIFFKDDIRMQYIVGASICAVMGALTMSLAARKVQERTVYNQKKKNPLAGYRDVLGSKYAWVIIASEFLKSFRGIATYMGIFLAVALLGDPGKYLFFGLPTGIGTAVGMLIINFLLKRFNAKQLYIASGCYSILANTATFCVGYVYFNNPTPVLQIVFIIFLFLIGLQFGASNLLPSMFQADVLEDLELKTGKRLDASLPFVIGIGTAISGTIATALSPLILYGPNSIIQYIPAELIDGKTVYFEQDFRTKILLLFFYTIFHGIMMLLAGVPFLFYKLTGATKEAVHEQLLAKREALAKSDAEAE